MANIDLPVSSVWEFHHSKNNSILYPGVLPSGIVRSCILRYSREGDLVLDPFVGSGTTLIECETLNRRAIGIDINPQAIKITRRRIYSLIKIEKNNITSIGIGAYVGDARDLKQFNDESIDLIIAHPPYWNAVKYSKEKGDLSQCKSIAEYLNGMKIAFREFYRVLKFGKYCCVIIGDKRMKKYLVPLGFHLLQIGLETGFKLKDIAIKVTGVGKLGRCGPVFAQAIKDNSLWIIHDYVLIFRKLK